MANRIPTLLATAVAAACSLSAHANGPTQADYAKVVLYADVTIAQDSASKWGLWEELEPTAAGPVTPVPLLAGAAGADLYRPIGDITAPPAALAACASGALCGFGVMFDPSSADPVQGIFALKTSFQLLPVATQANADSSQWLPQTMLVSVANVRFDVQGSPVFDNLGPLTLGGNTHGFTSGQHDANLNTNLADPGAPGIGKFNGAIVSYVSGASSAHNTYGVWGVTSTAQHMDALRGSGATASYSGHTFDASGASTGTVAMSVNFGASTFSATFNGGQDSYGVRVQSTANGTKQLQGPVGFIANGTISGSMFNATQLSANDPINPNTGRGPTVTGVVKGAFFGPQAAQAGGVVDITKTRPFSPDPKTTYTDGRYTAPFVANKQ